MVRLIGALLGVLLLVGCVAEEASSARRDTPPRASASRPTTVPAVVGGDLTTVGNSLSASGMRVVVVVPERRVVGDKTLRRKKGIIRPRVLPQLRADFKSRRWDHSVVDQEPAAGSAMTSQTVVVLVAGRHHGDDPTREWTSVHPLVVKKAGAEPCFEPCHRAEECADCHVYMLR